VLRGMIHAMKNTDSPKPSGFQPLPAIRSLSKSFADLVPSPMQPWQLAGFIDGLVCGLGPAPDEAFSLDEDPEQGLFLDCVDEISRDAENEDSPVPAEDIVNSANGPVLKTTLVSLVRNAETQLSSNDGHPELPFAETDIPAARAYSQGLLRGLVMSIEDEEELSDERYGEVLGLVFILTEDDLGSEFGSPAEVREARQSVIAALPGLVSQLWFLSHEEE